MRRGSRIKLNHIWRHLLIGLAFLAMVSALIAPAEASAQAVDLSPVNDTVSGAQSGIPESPVQVQVPTFPSPPKQTTPATPDLTTPDPGLNFTDPIPGEETPGGNFADDGGEGGGAPPGSGLGSQEPAAGSQANASAGNDNAVTPVAFQPFLEDAQNFMAPQRNEAFVAWLQQQLQSQISVLGKSDILRVAPADGSGFETIPPKLKDAASKPIAGLIFALVSIASYLGSLGKLRWPHL